MVVQSTHLDLMYSHPSGPYYSYYVQTMRSLGQRLVELHWVD